MKKIMTITELLSKKNKNIMVQEFLTTRNQSDKVVPKPFKPKKKFILRDSINKNKKSNL